MLEETPVGPTEVCPKLGHLRSHAVGDRHRCGPPGSVGRGYTVTHIGNLLTRLPLYADPGSLDTDDRQSWVRWKASSTTVSRVIQYGAMSEISIRELRNHGGDVVDRAAKGERLTITRSGKPVAELRPLSREPVPLDVVISRRRRLPPVDPDHLSEDLDRILDPAL